MKTQKYFGLTFYEFSTLALHVQKLLNKDIGSSVQILVPITDEDVSLFNLTKEQLANIVRDYILHTFPGHYTFVRFDIDKNILFDLSEYQIITRQAIRGIKSSDFETSVYIDEYKILLIGSYWGIDATISEVDPDQIEDAQLMVKSLDGTYGIIHTNFEGLKECYYGPRY